MKISVERDILLKSLNHIQSVVERRNTIPILSNVKIIADNEGISLTATDLDLEIIEKRMHEIVDRDEKTHREVWKRDKAISHFKEIGENYKAEIIESIPESEELTVYHHGDTWHDLCRGPHLVSSGKIGKAFKLTKVAGAYWRGDSNNEMLQRIY